MANKTPIHIELSTEEREELERRTRSLTAPYREVNRAKIVLLLAEGLSVSSVARKVGRERNVVRDWGWRFKARRLMGLEDAPRSGRPARFSPLCGDPSGQVGLRAA